VKEKPTAGSSFFAVFLSDRIPKAKKDAKVHFFIHCFNFTDELIIDSILAGKTYFQNIVSSIPIDSIIFLPRSDDFQFSRLPFCL